MWTILVIMFVDSASLAVAGRWTGLSTSIHSMPTFPKFNNMPKFELPKYELPKYEMPNFESHWLEKSIATQNYIPQIPNWEMNYKPRSGQTMLEFEYKSKFKRAKIEMDLEASKRNTETNLDLQREIEDGQEGMDTKRETDADLNSKRESINHETRKFEKNELELKKSTTKGKGAAKAKLKILKDKFKKKLKKAVKKCLKKLAKQILKEFGDVTKENSTMTTEKAFQDVLEKGLEKCLKIKKTENAANESEESGMDTDALHILPVSRTGHKVLKKMLKKSLKKALKEMSNENNAGTTLAAIRRSTSLMFVSLILAPHLVYLATIKFHNISYEV